MSFEGNFGSKPIQDTVTTLRSPHSATIGFVGARLRAMYQDLCKEPVPARLLDVVERFDRAADPQPPRGDQGNGTED
jgi:hypothetical protein